MWNTTQGEAFNFCSSSIEESHMVTKTTRDWTA